MKTEPGLNIANELKRLPTRVRSTALLDDTLDDDFERREPTRPIPTLDLSPAPTGFSLADDLSSAPFPHVEVSTMQAVENALAKMGDVSGFLGAIALLPTGEAIAEVGPASLKLAEVGAIANDVLLRAHSAARLMDVGDNNVAVEMTAQDAQIMLRCASGGDAHIHLCFVMAKNANLGMAKIWMGKIANELIEVMS